MRYVALLAASIFTVTALGAVGGCKQRRETSDVKSEDDIKPGEMQWVGSEKKWAITCREGRLHKGYRSTLIKSEDLPKACEDVDPNYVPGGGNGGGTVVVNPPNGGGASGSDWDVAAKCPNRPDKIKKINIALASGLIADLKNLPPALATQQLCTGFVSRLNQIVNASASLYTTLTGEVSGAPVLVLVDKAGTPVVYDDSAFTLTLPWKIDDAAIDQISAAMGGAGVNLCGAESVYVLKTCWFKTNQKSESCVAACARYQKQYDPRTVSLAGQPNGTNENCASVAGAFGQAFVGQNQYCNEGSGCAFIGAKAYRCYTKDTSGEATGAQIFSDPAGSSGAWTDALRYCACK